MSMDISYNLVKLDDIIIGFEHTKVQQKPYDLNQDVLWFHYDMNHKQKYYRRLGPDMRIHW
jgi:hypothetical protein